VRQLLRVPGAQSKLVVAGQRTSAGLPRHAGDRGTRGGVHVLATSKLSKSSKPETEQTKQHHQKNNIKLFCCLFVYT
jgi:hypothetical protein